MQENKKKEIRKQADDLRAKCKVGRYGILDLFGECEGLGYKLLRYPLGENTDLGFTMKKDNDIIIFTNTSSRLSREIFTLAHEIGHVKLHMGNTVSFIDNAVTIFGRNVDEKEQEANYFAACLLMPMYAVDNFLDNELEDFKNNSLSAMDIARIMSEFNVSFDMALNRLENLGKIDIFEKARLDNERNENRVGNLLRSVGGNARLNVASMDIDIPHEYIDYVIYNYNHRAIPHETLKRALEYYHLTDEDIRDRLVDQPETEDELDDLEDLIGGLED